MLKSWVRVGNFEKDIRLDENVFERRWIFLLRKVGADSKYTISATTFGYRLILSLSLNIELFCYKNQHVSEILPIYSPHKLMTS